MYNRTFYNLEELKNDLTQKVHSIDLNRIFSAYDLSDNAYSGRLRIDGTPYFFHITRITRIIVSELKVYDTDLIISSLLHDILITNHEISKTILELNFGSYTAFLIDSLTSDFHSLLSDSIDTKALELAGDDGLIIRLSQCLDDFRCLEYDILLNPINYMLKISNRYFTLAEKSNSIYVKSLLIELKKERNKLLG